MSTTQSTAPEDPRVIEHRLQQHSYFMPDSELKNLPENKHPESNADGGSSTAASQGNPTSPLTAHSQYGASVTSKQQIRTARSHPSSNESGSAESGFGQTVAPRRSTRRAQKAPNSRELPDDNRTASPSLKELTGERMSEGEEEELSGTSEDESDGPPAREPSKASRSEGGTVGGREHLARQAKKGSWHTQSKGESVWSGRIRSKGR